MSGRSVVRDAVQIECAVIGAGAVGLAVARELQRSGHEVFLFEREARFGTGASSRNSEVIHAGIYYRPGSLKATLCQRGKQLLYEYCTDRAIPFKQLGKLVVAVTSGEERTLEEYARTAATNGVRDLRWLTGAEVRRAEPEVRATAALLSPSTGILDSHQFMCSLLRDFLGSGGYFRPGSTVRGGAVMGPDLIQLEIDDGQRTDIVARIVVNCAGLQAPQLARRIDGGRPKSIPTEYYAIGHYFALSGPSPFRQLIYPVGGNGGLGVHVTLDMVGAARFGPDVNWIPRVDYSFDISRKPMFVDAIRRYYPGLEPDRLAPAYTGIRPKLSGSGDSPADFRIIGPRDTGHSGLVHLFGIESPGLTASMAIAEYVRSLLN